MDTFEKYAVEVIAAIWLVIVAIQYLSRYFITGYKFDFMPAYIAMLCILTLIVIWRAVGTYLGKNK